MWILTQNKMETLNCIHIYIKGNQVMGSTSNEFNIVLGTYETPERAKEILSNIFTRKSKHKGFSYGMPTK